MPGVSLADGTAVYAMSLVTKSTKPWSIYFGIPAKRLKGRSRGMLEVEKRFAAEHGAE
jgi:acetyltransferase-like isoleucine patch superfamily enzyme